MVPFCCYALVAVKSMHLLAGWFESIRSSPMVSIAQLVEQRLSNSPVDGSIPSGHPIHIPEEDRAYALSSFLISRCT